eukprot:732640-Rhodomonas_salina.2
MRSASGDLDGGFGAGLGVLHDVLVIQRRDRRMRVALACPPHTPRVSAQLTSAHARARAGHLHLGVEGGAHVRVAARLQLHDLADLAVGPEQLLQLLWRDAHRQVPHKDLEPVLVPPHAAGRGR